jgi:polyisoprenoid-binding protein YceI
MFNHVYLHPQTKKKDNPMNKSFIAAAALAVVAASCSNKAEETEVAASTAYTVDVTASSVEWNGEVVGVYGHNGTVKLASGTVEVADSQIVGGTFTIDMTSIWPTDSASYKDQDGGRATDLVAHLATNDFFGVDSFPTATFEVVSAEGLDKVNGKLTVKGVTVDEQLEISNLQVSEAGATFTGTLVFDRQKHGVSWKHFVKDYVLADDITVTFTVVATPAL